MRHRLADVDPAALVLVACSGGADSMALASATRFVRPQVGLVTVDHGLQTGSADQVAAVMRWAEGAGFYPAVSQTVAVGRAGGPEAAARTARYAALTEVAATTGAAVVLLGHTQDDQAETVLLGLLRGSGPRAIAGMPAQRGIFRRPLLSLPRNLVREAAETLPTWEDPHNTDPAYTRSRLRELLPHLDRVLGGGVTAGLARTADLIRADTEYLDARASDIGGELIHPDGALPAAELAHLPAALRTRILHRWAQDLGASPSALSSVHIAALDALVTRWRGQGGVFLPGGFVVERRGETLRWNAVPTGQGC